MQKEISLAAPQQKMMTSFTSDEAKVKLLKDMFFKDSTNDEFILFVHACERSGLDPFMKQIYPVKRWDSKLHRNSMTIQTGIDGYRSIAERTGKYAPGKEPQFTYDKEGRLLSATAYVKKLTPDGTWHEVPATAFFSEYVQTNKDGIPTQFWSRMPHGQLAKCAEALALRKAFPFEFSQIYTQEEMQQAYTPKESQEIEIEMQEDPQELEKKISEYICKFDSEWHIPMKQYATKYCDYYKKTFAQFLQIHSDEEKTLVGLKKWWEKQKAKEAVKIA